VPSARYQVVDQHGRLADARDVWPIGSVLGQRLVVAEPVDQGGFLTRDVAPRRRLQLEGDSRGAGALALVDGALEVVDHARVVARRAHRDAVGADRPGQVLGPVEDQVGVGRRQGEILVRRGLALHGVDHDELVSTA
jgi:hypothetical protein